MSIRLGVNTWVWTAPFRTETVKLFPKIRNMGFDVVELPIEDPALIDIAAVGEGLKRSGLACTTIGAFGPDRDLTHDDPKVQENCLDYIETSLAMAAAWSAPVLAGPMYSAVGKARLVPPDQKKREWERAVTNLRKAAKMAANAGVRLAMEVLNRFETDLVNTAEQAARMIRDVGDKTLGIQLDTFHMNIEEKSAAEAVKKAGSRLYHVHASESDRGIPGSAKADWAGLAKGLKAVRYDGAVVIESFTPDVTSIARAASIWRKLAPSQDALAKDGLKFLKKLLRGL